jgi:hypothetical protein
MRFKKNEKGSIIVEAALILPLFILLIVLLSSIIKIAIYEVALDHAVSEATKQISTHMYPVALAKKSFDETKYGQNFNDYYTKGQNLIDKYNQGLDGAGKLAEQMDFVSFNGVTLNDLVSTMKFDTEKIISDATAPIFTPIVEHYLDINLAKHGKMEVTGVKYPSFTDRANADFGLEVTYTFKLPLPFMSKNIILKKQAYERVWIGS